MKNFLIFSAGAAVGVVIMLLIGSINLNKAMASQMQNQENE